MNLRKRFERFCFRHRNVGIPNLMLLVSIASGIVFLASYFTESYQLYALLCFDRAKILQGELWRLISYVLIFDEGFFLWTLILLVCYYSMGRAIENIWGTLKFNLFYLSGVIMMDTFCMLFGGEADAGYLHMSLFLGYATLYPTAQFLVLFIIPIKARWLAMFDLAITAISVIMLSLAGLIPYNLFPLVALLNYFLFFGKDIVNIFPLSWQANVRRLFRKKQKGQNPGKPIPFPNAGSYEASVASVKAPYTHRCTVCGRTDESHPDLEFRYCSRCNGYYCYCIDHISNHTHVE